MRLQHAIMVSLMGKQADRFHEYQPARPLDERLGMISQITEADGIEVVYPQDFTPDLDDAVAQIQASGWPVSAVNLNVKGAQKWQGGSFTAKDPDLRNDAVDDLKLAMDLAVELGTDMVTCCPLIDGHNYAFQVDYERQWRWLEEAVAEGAAHRDDVRISLEYKLNEARNYCILGDMGRTLLLCERIGLPNVGVTMDVGHALLAKETPAEVMMLASRLDRLFYVHLNDNGREWDWDMLPGSVNVWDLVEMLYYMERIDWDGWIAYDVNARNCTALESMNATLTMVEGASKLVDRFGLDELEKLVDEGNPARTFGHLMDSLLRR